VEVKISQCYGVGIWILTLREILNLPELQGWQASCNSGIIVLDDIEKK
jgi:hypothetical protein